MNENKKTKDSDMGAEDQRFSPTDWDWVMLLSGEINAIETRSHAFANMFIKVFSMVIVVLIALLGITYSNYDSTNPSIIIYIIVLISLAILVYMVIPYPAIITNAGAGDEYRVKLLKECRDEIFDRLDDPNKVVERCLKKDDENR